MERRAFYVYILSNAHDTVFYIGVTNNIRRRLSEHRARKPGSFVARYNIFKLVHLEVYSSACVAIAREKQLKNWHRAWKKNLILRHNPTMQDLSSRSLPRSP